MMLTTSGFLLPLLEQQDQLTSTLRRFLPGYIASVYLYTSEFFEVVFSSLSRSNTEITLNIPTNDPDPQAYIKNQYPELFI